MAGPASNPEDESTAPSDNGNASRAATGFTAVNGRVSPSSQGKAKPEQQRQQQQQQQPDKEVTDAAKPRSTTNPSGAKSPTPPATQAKVNGVDAASSPAPPPPVSTSTATPAPAPAPSTPSHPTYTHHSNGASTSKDLPPSQNGVASPPKRKRSLSQERGNVNGPIYPGNSTIQSPGGQRMSIDGGNPRERDAYGRPVYTPPRDSYPPPPTEGYPPPPTEAYSHPPHEAYPAPPPPQHTYPPPPQDHANASEIYPRQDRHPPRRPEYEHPVDPSIAPSSQPYYSEAHLADALQRENRNFDNNAARAANYGTPEEEDDQSGQYGGYDSNRDPQAGLDIDRRKRKRVFSNRTKTGCMTCRRRKKKCDEQHPECNNCLRGGFMCEGYSARNTWQKPANTKQPIPLQSKNGYPTQPPGRAPYPPVARFDPSSEYPGPPPHQRPSFDGGRPGPMPVEEDTDPVYGRPDAKSQPGWNKASRPYPSNPAGASKYQGEGEHRGSIYEMPPEGTEAHAMPPPQPDGRNGSVSYPAAHNNTPPSHSNVQAAAQAALTHPAAIRPVSSNRREDMTERERMLKGLYYYPNTPALTADRENCIQAIWRFNNATNPSHGVSPEERMRLFRAILTLRPSPEPPLPSGEPAPSATSLPFGHCGERVVVEAPFHCDYGYNITIGDDVLIGADCRISDTCAVSIGARCIFSPNVKLICATYPIDPKRRQGSRGPALGRNIVIEEDCWIGANVTILAGVRVGKSSTVGAGSLLHQDVPRFTVVAGNPAKVSRGIYDGDS